MRLSAGSRRAWLSLDLPAGSARLRVLGASRNSGTRGRSGTTDRRQARQVMQKSRRRPVERHSPAARQRRRGTQRRIPHIGRSSRLASACQPLTEACSIERLIGACPAVDAPDLTWCATLSVELRRRGPAGGCVTGAARPSRSDGPAPSLLRPQSAMMREPRKDGGGPLGWPPRLVALVHCDRKRCDPRLYARNAPLTAALARRPLQNGRPAYRHGALNQRDDARPMQETRP